MGGYTGSWGPTFGQQQLTPDQQAIAQYIHNYQAPQPQPQQQSPVQQGVGAISSAIGNRIGSSLFSSSAPSATESALNIGASAPIESSASAAPYGAMTDAAGNGIGTLAGESSASALPASAGWMGAMAPAGVALIGAYTASRGLDAYKKGNHKGAWGGLKQGIQSAGPLNAVPVLGQLPWIAGALAGAFGGKKQADQYQRDAARSNAEDLGLTHNHKFGNFDIGQDDGATIDGHRYYQFDPTSTKNGNNQLAQGIALDFLSGGRTAGSDTSKGSTAMHFANALAHGEDFRKNLDASKLGFQGAFDATAQAANSGQISTDVARSIQNTLNQAYGREGHATGEGKGGGAGMMPARDRNYVAKSKGK